MCDRTPAGSHQRAQLLSLALGAQHGITFDDLLDLGDNWVQDVADLTATLDRAALDPRPQPEPQAEARTSLTWVGPVSFHRLTSTRAGINHDLGTRWGAQRDIRLSHRRPHHGTDGTDGLLYADDRTWDEYTILADSIDADTVEAAIVAALAPDPHLPVDLFPHVLQDVRAGQSADVAAAHVGPVLR